MNQKISVHIPFFLNNKKKNQKKDFKKSCDSFLKLSKNTEIFIHTNKKLMLQNKRVKIIYHKLGNRHPFKLTWYCRKLMEKQKNKYDIFIYSEDDILFTKKNLNYWFKYKNICIKNNYNLGFLRVERNKKNNKLYSSDQISKSSYYVKLNNYKFLVINNPYCAMWIYDKKEFGKFIKTKWWKFKWSLRSNSGILHLREMSALGWHGVDINGLDMGRYLSTIIPIKKEGIDKNSFIKHLPDNYANAPRGLFGTFRIEDIKEKNLEKFYPITKTKKISKKIKYELYNFFRINLKKHFKKNKLHEDLLKLKY